MLLFCYLIVAASYFVHIDPESIRESLPLSPYTGRMIACELFWKQSVLTGIYFLTQVRIIGLGPIVFTCNPICNKMLSTNIIKHPLYATEFKIKTILCLRFFLYLFFSCSILSMFDSLTRGTCHFSGDKPETQMRKCRNFIKLTRQSSRDRPVRLRDEPSGKKVAPGCIQIPVSV